MFEGSRVAVVIPCHNEEPFIRNVISTMPEFVDFMFVVNDASTDGTVAEAMAVGDSRVSILTLVENVGVGGATVRGYREALERGADVIVVMDGDGQMDPAFLRDVLTPVTSGGYGFAKANRFYSVDSFAGMPRHRVFGNVALTFLTKAASGYWDLVDPQNGYTAIRADVLRRLNLDRIATHYDFNNDLLVWLNILNVRLVDVPVPAVYGEEVSGLRVHEVAPRILRSLFVGFWRRVFMKYVWWSFSPVALLMLAGVFLLMVGGVFSCVALVTGFRDVPLPAATVVLSVMPLTLGVVLLVQAMTLDIQNTPR